MKTLTFILFIATLLPIYNSYAQSSGKGYTIISQEEIYNVDMPDWMQNNNNKKSDHINNFATVSNADSSMNSN